MAKFTLIAEDQISGKKVTYEFEDEYIDDVLSGFDDFLKGAGYHYDGQLIIKKSTDIYGETKYDFGDLNLTGIDEIKIDLNNTFNSNLFSSVVDDHITMLDNFDNVMNIDLSDIQGVTKCANCGCGKNAN